MANQTEVFEYLAEIAAELAKETISLDERLDDFSIAADAGDLAATREAVAQLREIANGINGCLSAADPMLARLGVAACAA